MSQIKKPCTAITNRSILAYREQLHPVRRELVRVIAGWFLSECAVFGGGLIHPVGKKPHTLPPLSFCLALIDD